MSEPSYIILPVSGNRPQHSDQETAESKSASTSKRLPSLDTNSVFSSLVASTVQHALHERKHPQPEHPGPFKQILGMSDMQGKIKEEIESVLTLTVLQLTKTAFTSILVSVLY